MLIDTHAHLNFNAFKDDADEVIKRSLAGGVFMINAGAQYSTSRRAVEMAEKYGKGIYAAVGLHPIHIKKTQSAKLKEKNEEDRSEEFDYEKYLELAKNPKVVAIGEVGLDYHHFDPPRVDEQSPRVEAGEGDDIPELIKKQKEIFLQFIKLANEVEKPLIIHCWGVKSGDHAPRDAYDDILEIMRDNPVEKKGVIHSFCGGYKTAGKFTELGYKIGLNGIITYAEDYNRLLKELSLDDIVLETDCPYLTPAPLLRNARNEPANVKYVAEKIAQIKEMSVDKIAGITTKNALAVFSLS